MEKSDLLILLGVVGTLYWYFNIRSQTKCIILNDSCIQV